MEPKYMSWYCNVEYLDSLVRDYLAVRGFLNTVKAFESDLKLDSSKGFRIERIMQHVISMVQSSDIDGLKKYWDYLVSKFATNCYAHEDIVLRKMELSLYRYYLVHLIQNSKSKEVVTFFQKMTSHLQQFSEWKEWFAIPFLPNPETNPTFQMYFTKQWIDTFLVSMHNFLSSIFARLPPPLLVKAFIDDGLRIQSLEKELSFLKENRLPTKEPSPIGIKHQNQPNYIKSVGEPGALVDKTPPATVQTVKKKSSPFSFVTKKDQKREQKPTADVQVPVQEKLNNDIKKSQPTNSKGISNFEAQRRELLASSTKKVIIPNKTTDLISNQSPKMTSLDPSKEESPSRRIASEVTQANSLEMEIPKSSTLSTYEFVNNLQTDNNMNPSLNNGTKADSEPFLVLSKDTFLEHHSKIVQCRFDSTGTTVASIDIQGVVKAWRFDPHLKTLATVMFRKPILCIQWCIKPDYLLLLGTSSGTIRFFNTATNMTHEDVQVHEKYSWVTLISTHPAGTSFVASCVKPLTDEAPRTSSKGILQVWDIKANQIKLNRCLNGDKLLNEVTCMEFNHNGNLLLAGDVCGNIAIFDMNTYEVFHTWDTHIGSVYGLELSTDENRVISFSVENTLVAFDLNQVYSPPVVYKLPPDLQFGFDDIPKGRIMTFDPEGNYLILCCGKEVVILTINEEKRSLSRVFSVPCNNKSLVAAIDWASSNSCGHCLTGAADGKIQVTTLLSQNF